jgi:hypothetical protein
LYQREEIPKTRFAGEGRNGSGIYYLVTLDDLKKIGMQLNCNRSYKSRGTHLKL